MVFTKNTFFNALLYKILLKNTLINILLEAKINVFQIYAIDINIT